MSVGVNLITICLGFIVHSTFDVTFQHFLIVNITDIKLIQLFFIFRPCDRNVKDVELIAARLRRVEQLYRLPNSVLQQLALCGYYEDLEKGVTRKLFSYSVI